MPINIKELSPDEILNLCREVVSIKMEIPVKEIELTDRLIQDLGCDSLDQVIIAMELEEMLDISFPDMEFDNGNATGIVTIIDLATTVTKCAMRRSRGFK